MSFAREVKERTGTRTFHRYRCFSDLSITYEGYGGDVPLHAPDLGPRGMFIHTSLHFPEGAVIRVKFRLSRSNFQVSARAEVRYRLPDVGIGVEFIEISPEAQQAIEEELGIA